jgi:hypothetical protein
MIITNRGYGYWNLKKKKTSSEKKNYSFSSRCWRCGVWGRRVGHYVSGYLFSFHFAVGILQGTPPKPCHLSKAVVEFPVMGWCTLVREVLAETVQCCCRLAWCRLNKDVKSVVVLLWQKCLCQRCWWRNTGLWLGFKTLTVTQFLKVTFVIIWLWRCLLNGCVYGRGEETHRSVSHLNFVPI